jgi:hypothetical protein
LNADTLKSIVISIQILAARKVLLYIAVVFTLNVKDSIVIPGDAISINSIVIPLVAVLVYQGVGEAEGEGACNALHPSIALLGRFEEPHYLQHGRIGCNAFRLYLGTLKLWEPVAIGSLPTVSAVHGTIAQRQVTQIKYAATAHKNPLGAERILSTHITAFQLVM